MHLSKSERVLLPGERSALAWLRAWHGHSTLEVRPSGGVGFMGYVLDCPRVQPATFLTLLARELIEPAPGYGILPDVKALPDREMPDAAEEAGNVVQLRHCGWRGALAKWFFTLSQRIAADDLTVEPHGFALVLVGRDRLEVMEYGLTVRERGQAATALLRHHAPGLAGWARAYAISPRGRAVLEVADLEARIDAAPGYREAMPLLVERQAKLDMLLPRASAREERMEA